MTQTTDDVRQLVKIVEIDSIDSIPDADSIEVARVGGWNIVVKKGEFHPGDSGVYFEIDSCLPLDDDRFAFLRPRGVYNYQGREYHRLQTARLRGVVSQGLLLPFHEFAREWEVAATRVLFDESFTLGDDLGVLKYDDIAPGATVGGDIAGRWPGRLGRKTDSERVQNLARDWFEIISNGPWTATEKIDGTSLSVFRQEDGLVVCSRNYQIVEGDNVYWNAVRRYFHIFDALKTGEGIQAEIAGPGIQGNPLALPHMSLFVFSVLEYGHPVPRHAWSTDVRDLSTPEYPLELPETVEEAIAQADGIKSRVNPARLSEGIVWHQKDSTTLKVLGDRPNFKVISNKYLIKDKR